MDLKEIGVDVMNWMELTHGRHHYRVLLLERKNEPTIQRVRGFEHLLLLI